MKAVFIRAIETDVDGKASALRDSIRATDKAAGMTRFEVDPSTFSVVPKSPFAYWTSDVLRDAFGELPAFGAERRAIKQGLATADDFRFLRLATEAPTTTPAQRWLSMAKGGRFSLFYADVYLMVNWEQDAREIWANVNSSGVTRSNIRMLRKTISEFFFRPALTWPLRTQSGLSMRAMPSGCVFGHKGPAAFVGDNDTTTLLALLAISNSRCFAALVELHMAFGSYEVGVLQRTPIPDLTRPDCETLATLSGRAWSLKRALDTRVEASHAFTLPAVLQVDGATLSARAEVWLVRVAAVESELAGLQSQIEDHCFTFYGIDDAERERITKGFAGVDDRAEPDEDDEGDDEKNEEIDVEPMAESLLSWALGVAFGRFDVRLATGTRALPAEPKPFDPLPVCAPGMLTGEDGLPLAAAPGGYPLTFPRDGVLVDDLGHPQDLLAHVNRVFEVVFGEHASERLLEAESYLGRRNEDLRTWFARRFFATHVKRYSRSRRKAPIYWQLGTPSASYSVWCYCHRLDGDTFFRLAELVQHKVDHEEGKLNTLRQEAGADPSSKDRRAIDAQESFVAELRAFKNEVERVAPLWNPNLDDGIIIHFALLWRLVPHDKPWQRECKKVWEKLQQGDYDWAHLAMHLWPERVVPKCAKDRSLAIAHGLESDFWFEDEDGKWKPRKAPATRVGELVAERSSSAVKAALGALVSAPVQGGAKGRGPKRGGA